MERAGSEGETKNREQMDGWKNEDIITSAAALGPLINLHLNSMLANLHYYRRHSSPPASYMM